MSVLSVSCFEIGFKEKSRGYVSEIREKIVTGMRSEAVDMNGRFQIQGGKNGILPK
jgi:hypothetical protein